MTPIIVRATEEHAIAIAPRLRLVDGAELRQGVTPEQIAVASVRGSTDAWAWLVEDRPIALFGVVQRSIGAGAGCAWLLATDDIRRHLRTFWPGSKAMLAQLLSRYAILDGCVDARFAQSVRWLEKLGFRLDETKSFRGVPFRYFKLDRAWTQQP